MTNPVLKSLSRQGLSRSEIADLLEKHIGPGTNELHCKEAFDALNRIRDLQVGIPARVTGLLIGNGSNYCEMVRQCADQIRHALPDSPSTDTRSNPEA